MTSGSGYGINFVGNHPELLPGQSAFGWLARLARLNQLRPKDFHHMFGLRLKRSDDLMRFLAMSERAKEVLADSLMHGSFDTWRPRFWFPFEGGPDNFALESFRYCLGCIRVGYHPMLHQMPWITVCPWHGIRLRSGCPRCGGSITVSGDVERKLLSCGCGLDLFNESAAARLSAPPHGAADTIAQRASEASAARKDWLLVGLPNVPLTSAMLAALISPDIYRSGRWSRRDRKQCHNRSFREALSDKFQTPRSWPKELMNSCPAALELPETWARSVYAVARNLATKLPDGSLTLQEHILFLGGQIADSSKFSPADRGTSGTVRCLPPMAAGPRRFLDLSSVHPVVVRTMAELARSPGRIKTIGPENAVAAGTSVTQRVAGALLCRGYAEGLRAILSRYVPALYGSPRDRPHLSAAWILVNRRTDEVRVAFAEVDKGVAPSDALTSAYSKN